MRTVAKKTLIFVCCIILVLSSTISIFAMTLNYWYSDTSIIGKWTTSPTVWFSKLDSSGSFAFLSGLMNGRSIWNNALGLSIVVTSAGNGSTAPIKYYGGTKSQIDTLNIFAPVPSTELGATTITSSSLGGVHYYNNNPKTWRIINNVIGYVVSRSDMNYNNYIKTASHEMGHALGWFGHPISYQSTWVMQQGKLENISLAINEKNHLAQIY